MKRFFLTVLLLNMLLATAIAQYIPVDTARINKAYNTLTKGNRTSETEMEFLEAYPTTWFEFYMTYSYLYDDTNQNIMCDMCSEHISTLFGLSHINDTVLCQKIINLSIGMKDSGECTGVFQDYLIGYILNHEKLVFDLLSKLRKGHLMEFWQFCWSTVTECSRVAQFEELYNRNKEKYPEIMEASSIAFENFYDGINYPTLLPHKEEMYKREFINKNYNTIFDDYEK